MLVRHNGLLALLSIDDSYHSTQGTHPITEKQDEQAAAGNSAAWLRRIEQLNILVSISLA